VGKLALGLARAERNLLRVLGTGVGVAAASATLGWRLEVIAREAGASEPQLLAAVGGALLMLAAMAALGTVMAFMAQGFRARAGAAPRAACASRHMSQLTPPSAIVSDA
jgi:hypothetical protein